MERHPDPDHATEEFWRDFLTRGDANERKVRRVFRRLPHEPRCMLCAAPFAGPAAPVMRAIGKRPSDKNPTMCTSCFDFMASHHGGAEIECSFLFADVRGSTTIAEAHGACRVPTSARPLLCHRYDVLVIDHDGSIDKFVGDELVAMYFPLLSGARHAERAVDDGEGPARGDRARRPGGPWLPLGAGVHTGPAWVGAVGEGPRTDLTALGDTVNTTARLASVAGAGEILVSATAAAAAELDPGLERRSLDLKGKANPTEVFVVRV